MERSEIGKFLHSDINKQENIFGLWPPRIKKEKKKEPIQEKKTSTCPLFRQGGDLYRLVSFQLAESTEINVVVVRMRVSCLFNKPANKQIR